MKNPPFSSLGKIALPPNHTGREGHEKGQFIFVHLLKLVLLCSVSDPLHFDADPDLAPVPGIVDRYPDKKSNNVSITV